MNSKNHRRLLMSLTDTILVWLDEMADQPGVKLPYVGNNTAVQMAASAICVLEAIDDLYDTLVENGEVKNE